MCPQNSKIMNKRPKRVHNLVLPKFLFGLTIQLLLPQKQAYTKNYKENNTTNLRLQVIYCENFFHTCLLSKTESSLLSITH